MKNKIVFLTFLAIGVVYIAYLHLKIVLYKRLLADVHVSEIYTVVAGTKLLSKHEERELMRYFETRLVNLWESFDEPFMQSHPGKAIWRYRIEKALRDFGDAKARYSVSLQKSIDALGKSEPHDVREFYEVWNNRILNWWP